MIGFEEHNFLLTSNLPFSQYFREKGMDDFFSACRYIQSLPYKRNKNKEDLFCVITDEYGTCSTKHALLKRLAIENRADRIKLVMGIFRMNAINTPRIKSTLEKYGLDYIPEAHNYLMADDDAMDYTGSGFSFENIRADLMFELEIQPDEITDFKVSFHQELLKKWLLEQPQLKIDFNKLWAIREECIHELSIKY